ncbi:hypothetical protein ABBQ32_006282 [Trebouxia sp. C0010 RCD-2024]
MSSGFNNTASPSVRNVASASQDAPAAQPAACLEREDDELSSPGSTEAQLGVLDDTGDPSEDTVVQCEKLIGQSSRQLKKCDTVQEQSGFLCKRSGAFARLSKHLRAIPAAQSERQALSGLDPFHLAHLALNDACKAADLAPTAKAYELQGEAQLLLEAYRAAETAFLAGLGIDPTDQGLMRGLQLTHKAISEAEEAEANPHKRARVADRVDEFECILCLKMLYQPVTTPCGHTFCRDCFLRAGDHSNKCPMCRTVLHVGRTLPITVTLQKIIEKSFPGEYAQRRADALALEAHNRADGPETPLPLFVMSCMMPGERMELNIFEPRYRLLVRRCMEGNRRFGMATVNQRSQLSPVACQCEILECLPLPDGRFYLEIEGKQRFRVVECWEQDGYRVARPQYFSDNPPPAASEAQTRLASMCQSVDQLANIWLDKVRAIAVGNRHSRFAELVARAGDRPASSDAENFSFWVANLIPLNASDKYKLLSMTSSADRLKFEHDMLKGGVPGGCCIM